MKTLIEHLRVLHYTLRRLLLTPNATLLNILIIGIALSLPVGGYVLLKSVQTLGSKIAGTPQISVFLAAGTGSADIERIGDKLKQHAGIKSIEFVSREVALKKLQQSTGMSDVIGGLSQNPLPDAFVVYPKDGNVKALEALRDELKTWPRFEHVQLDSAWIHKLEALLDFGRMAVAILAALLSFALIAITFNTIRLQILTRREEIEVAKLIGATDAFIRRPFLYFGGIQGLAGGLAGWLLVVGGGLLLQTSVAEVAAAYGSQFHLAGLSFKETALLLLLSTALGWLGAYFAVGRALRESDPYL